MHNIKYEIGLTPLNIYTDRPSPYIAQLSALNANLFIIGKYDGKIPYPFNRVKTITADIRPHIVISQTKLENFNELQSFANDYRAIFIHYESNLAPNKMLPAHLVKIKMLRANLNVFTDFDIAKSWGFNDDESCIIPNSYIVEKYAPKVPFIVASSIPAYEMSFGSIPILPITNENLKYIKVGYNGFVFKDEGELKFVINQINNMDKEDVKTIGLNAMETIKKHFTPEVFIENWRKALKNII